ncbi:hypothetical protein SAMN06295987_1263 [Novosphingobium mathurense]|uniref:Uncharacterized protein n=1 Tax=Novosphingobium mathurense TaxID=428990 RepID=A0A1U6IYY4_9SPHN|nr:hypothetical protein SAMN06295987_1263 [Novosphingobium mathurense]
MKRAPGSSNARAKHLSHMGLPRRTCATLIERGLVPDMPLPSLVYAIVGMVRLPFVLAREAQLAMGYDFMKGKAIDAHANCVIQLLMHR